MASLSEYVALEVNDEDVSLSEVLRLAKFVGNLKFLSDAIDAALVGQAAEELQVEITDEELQQAADEFRLARELHDAEATERWLAAQHLSYEDWEAMLEAEVTRRKLRERLTKGRIEQHFAEQRLAFDVAALSRIVAESEDVARELRVQVVEEGADFHALARQFSIDEATRAAGGYAGLFRRAELETAVEPVVFGASAGKVVGPFKTDDGWTLYKVEQVRRATLDEETRAAIETHLFDEWLGEQRRKAKIGLPILTDASD
ncbi:MAG TPA: peptidylprolyl isomerase [Pyrinomonadaceae bacterium]|jgi:putative peptide maturation system protein